MDFVTITDHDSIDGCLYLLNRDPDLTDFFISEEVETWFPDTRQRIHVNVFGIDENQHREIQRRRANIYDLHAYLRAEGIIASANHMFQNYRFRNSPRRYFEEMLRMFDIFEVKNGAMATAAQPARRGPDVARAGEARQRLPHRGLRRAHPRPACPGLHGGGGADRRPSSWTRSARAAASSGARRWASGCCSPTCTAWSSVTTGASWTGGTRSSRAREKARHLAIAAFGAPFSAAGLPLAVTSLNYLKQIFVSRRIGQELLAKLDEREPS